jgi:hypothetical protein
MVDLVYEVHDQLSQLKRNACYFSSRDGQVDPDF